MEWSCDMVDEGASNLCLHTDPPVIVLRWHVLRQEPAVSMSARVKPMAAPQIRIAPVLLNARFLAAACGTEIRRNMNTMRRMEGIPSISVNSGHLKVVSGPLRLTFPHYKTPI